MEYNTTQEKLLLPEYGRNVQKMALHLFTIEDRTRRTRAAQELIAIMGNMFPNLREARDFKHKLWDQLAAMTNYKLDVDYPFEITRPDQLPHAQRPAYNNYDIEHRHYGKIVEDLIVKAIELEESDEKKWLIQLIANHMKKQYITWNKNTVNDDIIYKDLINMSKGKLNIDTTLKIHVNTSTLVNNYPQAPHHSGYSSNNNNRFRQNNNTNNSNNKRKPFTNNNNNSIKNNNNNNNLNNNRKKTN